MKIDWHISRRDVDRVKKLIKEQTAAGNNLIRYRKKTNLKQAHVTPFWHRRVSASPRKTNPGGEPGR